MSSVIKNLWPTEVMFGKLKSEDIEEVGTETLVTVLLTIEEERLESKLTSGHVAEPDNNTLEENEEENWFSE